MHLSRIRLLPRVSDVPPVPSRSLRFVRRLHSYYGDVRLPAFVHHRLKLSLTRCGPSCRTAQWPNAGSPSFRNDLCERDLAFDPGGTTMPRKAASSILRSTVETVSAPSDKDISWLNPRPHAPAVYASCAALPSPHATLATGRLARPYPGRTCTGRSLQLTLAPSSTHPTRVSVAAYLTWRLW